jgi:uncharacterized protein (TIGR00251 family)
MISQHSDGVAISVWVVPGASQDEVVGVYGDALKVRTVAPPEGGKANRRVAELVADMVGGSGARVIAGATSRTKRVLVDGVDIDAVRHAVTT